MVRGLLSDDDWSFFTLLVIEQGPKRGCPPIEPRRVLDEVFYVARTASPWRDLPEALECSYTNYQQFRHWTQVELWDVLIEALARSGVVQDSVQMVGSTIVRAHHCAAGPNWGVRHNSTCRHGPERLRGGSRLRSTYRRTRQDCPLIS